MAGTQFQIESPHVTSGSRFRLDRSSSLTASHLSKQTGLQALMLAVNLRGRLCDRERQLIDDLSPDQHLAFLTMGDEYLHPESFPLFPKDVTSDFAVLESTAFSYRRLRAGLGRNNGTFGVYTAQIGQFRGAPLVFGTAGPDVASGEVDRNHSFARIVNDLRRASSQVGDLAERLRTALSSESPVILVLRSSGRVLATNAAVQSLLPPDLGDIVDKEWGEVKRDLVSALVTHSLKLESVGNGDLSVAVVTLSAKVELRPIEYESFLDLVQHKAAALAASARHLRSLACCVPGETNSELVQIILEEAEDLRTCLERLRMIDSFEGIAPSQFDLVEELRLATLQVLKGNHQASIVISNDGQAPVRLEAPRIAARSLLETLLRLHVRGSSGDGKTELVVSSSSSASPTTLEFLSSDNALHGKGRQSAGAWLAYAERLATLLGWKISHSAGVDFRAKSVLSIPATGDRR
ncbi:MAG: hypothetical protein AB1644_11220 [Candidatus Zixiibacteriota bacterium]